MSKAWLFGRHGKHTLVSGMVSNLVIPAQTIEDSFNLKTPASSSFGHFFSPFFFPFLTIKGIKVNYRVFGFLLVSLVNL